MVIIVGVVIVVTLEVVILIKKKPKENPKGVSSTHYIHSCYSLCVLYIRVISFVYYSLCVLFISLYEILTTY
jgi:hypothetical protein